jgi:hypothetical protein
VQTDAICDASDERRSLNALIDRQQVQFAEFENRRIAGQNVPGLEGIIAQAEQHLDELNNRLETRKRELELEKHFVVSDITQTFRRFRFGGHVALWQRVEQ